MCHVLAIVQLFGNSTFLSSCVTYLWGPWKRGMLLTLPISSSASQQVTTGPPNRCARLLGIQTPFLPQLWLLTSVTSCSVSPEYWGLYLSCLLLLCLATDYCSFLIVKSWSFLLLATLMLWALDYLARTCCLNSSSSPWLLFWLCSHLIICPVALWPPSWWWPLASFLTMFYYITTTAINPRLFWEQQPGDLPAILAPAHGSYGKKTVNPLDF